MTGVLDDIDESKIIDMSDRALLMNTLRVTICNSKDIQSILEKYSLLSDMVITNARDIQRNTGDLDDINQLLEEQMSEEERLVADRKQHVTWAIAVFAISVSLILGVLSYLS